VGDGVTGRSLIGRFEAFMDDVPMLRESLDVWTADTGDVVDWLEGAAHERDLAFLRGRIDLDRLGVFGMSFGGATATRFCGLDDRCRSGVNLDGQVYGDVVGRPPGGPFMFMNNERSTGMNRVAFDATEEIAYHVTVPGTRHADFTDANHVLPVARRIDMFGSIGPARMSQIMNGLLTGFFDEHLRGHDGATRRAIARLREIDVQIRNENRSD
jgi:pimeloyl-ACP methyl ester carboxylesterase